jgi:glyoxylase-like metal-dependent hydrolase (beta-lactamase superfamily II)
MSSEPQVQSWYHEPTGSFTHLLRDSESRAAAVVDPVLDYDPASGRLGTSFLEPLAATIDRDRLELVWILETHAHADHLSAAAWLRERAGGRLGAGQGIREVQARFADFYHLGADFVPDGRQFDRLFAEGDILPLGGLRIRVMATPGHTSDSVAYIAGNAAFIGDTMFAPDYGTARCDFPGGDAADLFRSIQRLLELPPETALYLCHDYPPDGRAPRASFTVAEQRQGNVHLQQAPDPESFVALRNKRDAGLDVPQLILPALQVNIRAGCLPEPEANGTRYLKIPLDRM